METEHAVIQVSHPCYNCHNYLYNYTQVAYNTMNPKAPPQFYQCADVMIKKPKKFKVL